MGGAVPFKKILNICVKELRLVRLTEVKFS